MVDLVKQENEERFHNHKINIDCSSPEELFPQSNSSFDTSNYGSLSLPLLKQQSHQQFKNSKTNNANSVNVNHNILASVNHGGNVGGNIRNNLNVNTNLSVNSHSHVPHILTGGNGVSGSNINNVPPTPTLTNRSQSLQPLGALSHAEKRANHNAIERARRESLNIRFLELAQSIPSLVHVRKPSKSIIVSKTIEFIFETKQRLEVKSRSLQLVRQQNEEFKAEINRLRHKLGLNSVTFPENVDLDFVFEANLEHQCESDPRFSSSYNLQHFSKQPFLSQQHQQQQQRQHLNTAFRAHSPFDVLHTMNGGLDEDDDDRSDRRSYSASLLSPIIMSESDSQDYRPLSAGCGQTSNHALSQMNSGNFSLPTHYTPPHQPSYPVPMPMTIPHSRANSASTAGIAARSVDSYPGTNIGGSYNDPIVAGGSYGDMNMAHAHGIHHHMHQGQGGMGMANMGQQQGFVNSFNGASGAGKGPGGGAPVRWDDMDGFRGGGCEEVCGLVEGE